MNTKEIAAATGKDETSIRRWVKRAADKMPAITGKMTASSPMHPADYSFEETLAIIEAGMGKNAAGVFRANAEKSKSVSAGETLTQHDIELIDEIVSMTVSKTFERLDQQMSTIKTHYQQSQSLLSLPQISDRDNLNKLVREYAQTHDAPHSMVWGMIYRDMYYRLNINVRLRAEHKNISVIEYIEQEGLMSEALAVAREIFK